MHALSAIETPRQGRGGSGRNARLRYATGCHRQRDVRSHVRSRETGARNGSRPTGPAATRCTLGRQRVGDPLVPPSCQAASLPQAAPRRALAWVPAGLLGCSSFSPPLSLSRHKLFGTTASSCSQPRLVLLLIALPVTLLLQISRCVFSRILTACQSTIHSICSVRLSVLPSTGALYLLLAKRVCLHSASL